MGQKFFEWMNRRYRLVTVMVLVLAVLMAGVFAALGSDDEPEFDPSGEIYDTQQRVEDVFAVTTGLQGALFLVEGADQRDVLTRNALLEWLTNSESLRAETREFRDDPLNSHLVTTFSTDFNVEIDNVYSIADAVDAELAGGLKGATDADGKVVFVSGDRDPNGDVRDLHSLYVHNGEMKLDKYLFSLQSRFLVRMVRGGEREQVIAVNYSPDPLPFLRPSTRSTIVLSRPVGARKHRLTISPLKSKRAKYVVKRKDLQGSRGPYSANVKLIAQMVPVNLIHEIQGVGFDYFMSPREIADGVVEGAQILYDRDVPLQ